MVLNILELSLRPLNTRDCVVRNSLLTAWFQEAVPSKGKDEAWTTAFAQHQVPTSTCLKQIHRESILRPTGHRGEDGSSGLRGWSCDPHLANHHILL